MNGHSTRCHSSWCAGEKMGPTRAPCLKLRLKMQVCRFCNYQQLCLPLAYLTEEIVSKITLILESQGSEARREYLEHDVITRRSSKSSVTSQ